MKTIGLIGGMSWESSAVYYELLNKQVKKMLGGLHSCKSIMFSVDFAEIQKLQHKEDWDTLGQIMSDAAKSLEAAGADIILLCSNTMHLCTPAILKSISIPFLHIAEATGMEIARKHLKKVALLGTKFTMEKDFYKQYIVDNFNVDVIIPEARERTQIHRVIYDELVHGIVNDESREVYKKIIGNLQKKGAEGVILGCTEIPMLISQQDLSIPIFSTTNIHAKKAVEWALYTK